MPRVTMVAGPNGSGKSTLIAELAARGVTFGEFLNADDIAKKLPGDPVRANAKAQALVRERRDAALAARRDYCWETVMSHPSHIDHLRAARQAGYETWIFYVATEDWRVNALRVAERVDRGGHDVPLDRIAARYAKSVANLPLALEAADFGSIYDNSRASDPFRLLCDLRGERMTLHAAYDEMPVWFQATLRTLARRSRIVQ